MKEKKKLSDYEKMTYVGQIGEKIVTRYFSSIGKKISPSLDPFDNSKDLVVDGKHIEVKTQVPFRSENSFSVRQEQLGKILTCDAVVFISIPNSLYEHKSMGKAYICENPSDIVFKKKVTSDGRKMILFPIDQKGLKELFTLTEEDVIMLKRFSLSKTDKPKGKKKK